MLKLGENHQYIDTDAPWTQYHSVSKVKEHVEQPFDERANALRCSQKPASDWFEMPVEEILREWHNISREGKRTGDMLHDCAYRYFSKPTFKPRASQSDFDDTVLPHLRILKDRYKLEHKNLVCEMPIGLRVLLYDGRWANCLDKMTEEELRAEVATCSEKTGRQWPEGWEVTPKNVKKFLTSHGLAGTPDMVDLHERFFDVHDYKTDKEIRTKGFFLPGRYGETEKLLEPLRMLDSCNYELYCLQVHLYGIMLEKKLGIPFRMGYIHHWNKKLSKFNTMVVWDRREHSRSLLHHYFKRRAA